MGALANRPRSFDSGNHGYHNATLGTTGIGLALPVGCTGFVVSVSAGCYIGVRGAVTLAAFSDANYGSISAGAPVPFTVQSPLLGGGEDFIHIAPWTGTAEVAICFT